MSSILNLLHTEDEEAREDGEDEEEDDEPINPLVNALFDEIQDLRLQVRSHSQWLLGSA